MRAKEEAGCDPHDLQKNWKLFTLCQYPRCLRGSLASRCLALLKPLFRICRKTASFTTRTKRLTSVAPSYLTNSSSSDELPRTCWLSVAGEATMDNSYNVPHKAGCCAPKSRLRMTAY